MKFVVCILVACAVAQQVYGYAVDSSSDADRNERNDNTDSDYGWQGTSRDNSATRPTRTHTESLNIHTGYESPSSIPYYTKINDRLAKSPTLWGRPEVKQQIQKIADEKFNLCRVPGLNVQDRHCVGRMIGQMMQMISEIENSSRSFVYAS